MRTPTGAYIRRDPVTNEVQEISLIIRPEDLIEEKTSCNGEQEDRAYVIRGAENRKHI